MFLGLAVLAGLIAFGRSAASADPARVAQRVRTAGKIAAIVLGLAFLARGVLLIALPLIGFGLASLLPRSQGADGAHRSDGAGERQHRAGGDGANPGPDMTREEAYAVLGLDPGADEAAILEAHKRLIKRLHPDGGGSSALAAKVNRARQVLLGLRG